MRESRLRQLGHILTREKTEVVRLVKEMCIVGKRCRGRSKRDGGCDKV